MLYLNITMVTIGGGGGGGGGGGVQRPICLVTAKRPKRQRQTGLRGLLGQKEKNCKTTGKKGTKKMLIFMSLLSLSCFSFMTCLYLSCLSRLSFLSCLSLSCLSRLSFFSFLSLSSLSCLSFLSCLYLSCLSFL